MVVPRRTRSSVRPEIKIGNNSRPGRRPQRITRALGKARPWKLSLTGRTFRRARIRAWAVSEIVAREETLPQRWPCQGDRLDARLRGRAAKESVTGFYELSLEAGLEFERRNSSALRVGGFRKEGMAAFIEKRPQHGRVARRA